MPARSSASSEVVDAARRRHAGGVAEREPVGARVEQVPGELRDPLGRDVAFVRAPERGRHDRLDRDARAVRELDDVARADRATRRPSGARSSGCASRSRSPRARARRPCAADRQLGALRVRHERASTRRRAGGRSRAMTSSAPAIGGIAPARRTTRPRCAAVRCRRARRSAAPGRRPAPAPRSAGRRAVRPHGSRRAPATGHRQAMLPRRPLTRSRRRTRILIGVGPRSNASRSLRSR